MKKLKDFKGTDFVIIGLAIAWLTGVILCLKYAN